MEKDLPKIGARQALKQLGLAHRRLNHAIQGLADLREGWEREPTSRVAQNKSRRLRMVPRSSVSAKTNRGAIWRPKE